MENCCVLFLLQKRSYNQVESILILIVSLAIVARESKPTRLVQILSSQRISLVTAAVAKPVQSWINLTEERSLKSREFGVDRVR